MKTLTVLLIILFALSVSRSEEAGRKISSRISDLQTELLGLRREFHGIPEEEADKASDWLKDAKKNFEFGNLQLAGLLVEKALSQIQFLRAAALELTSREETNKLSETLDKIQNQIQEIKQINEELVQEISLFEQK